MYTLTVSSAYCVSGTSQVTVTPYVTSPSCCRLINPDASENGAGEKSAISIYPNSGDGRIAIHTKETTDKITITDLVGRIVFEGKPSSNHTDLDISNEPKGIYLVKIRQSGKKHIEKISIE